MTAKGRSKTNRRTMLVTLGGLAGVSLANHTTGASHDHAAEGPAAKVDKQSQMSKVQQEYKRLRQLWQNERKNYESSSNTRDYWKGPHGKAIIALGPAIIPELIHELRQGDFWFNVPLEAITKVDIANGKLLSEQERSKLWLRWWAGPKKGLTAPW